jgi:uncharacterized protein YbbC (DUF1343 family)
VESLHDRIIKYGNQPPPFPALWIAILFSLSTALSQEHPSIHQIELEQHREEPARPELQNVRTGLEILLTMEQDRLAGKTVGLVTNHTGVDRDGVPSYRRLMALPGVRLQVIFTPEHGLFGEAAAGETVAYQAPGEKFPRIVSLYGRTRKPTREALTGLDLILYDVQDVGARFYTYISTLGLVMEAAAEAGVPVWVLDRPNPLTTTIVEGPVLKPAYRSFVGYYPIPTRYGMTVGELARMIVGEQWIDPVPVLKVIPMENYRGELWYDETTVPWIPPSPNIPDLETALVYPGMCLLEATNVSEGRGTPHPFRWFGAPWINGRELAMELNRLRLPGVVFRPIQFTPVDLPGKAIDPKYEGKPCSGVEINVVDRDQYRSVPVGIRVLVMLRTLYPDQLVPRREALNRLWGSDELYTALVDGRPAEAIMRGYRESLQRFRQKRKPYRLY